MILKSLPLAAGLRAFLRVVQRVLEELQACAEACKKNRGNMLFNWRAVHVQIKQWAGVFLEKSIRPFLVSMRTQSCVEHYCVAFVFMHAMRLYTAAGRPMPHMRMGPARILVWFLWLWFLYGVVHCKKPKKPKKRNTVYTASWGGETGPLRTH